MRYLSLLFVATLLVGCAGSQHTDDLPEGVSDREAPMRAQTVIVSADTNADAAYKAAAAVLQEEGYALSNTDLELRSLTTERKSAEWNGSFLALPAHRLSVSATGDPTHIRLNGAYFEGSVQNEIQKYGKSTSPQRLAWAKLITVADAVAERVNGDLSFEK